MSRELSSNEYTLPVTRAEYEGNKPVRIVRAAARIAVIAGVAGAHTCLFVHHPTKGLELPGGAIEPGESPLQAVVRELGEETGVHLADDHAFSLVGILPVKDSRGGYWVDIIYGTVIDPLHQSNSFSNLQSTRAEFPISWLTFEEVEQKVDPNNSSYTGARQCLIRRRSHEQNSHS